MEAHKEVDIHVLLEQEFRFAYDRLSFCRKVLVELTGVSGAITKIPGIMIRRSGRFVLFVAKSAWEGVQSFFKELRDDVNHTFETVRAANVLLKLGIAISGFGRIVIKAPILFIKYVFKFAVGCVKNLWETIGAIGNDTSNAYWYYKRLGIISNTSNKEEARELVYLLITLKTAEKRSELIDCLTVEQLSAAQPYFERISRKLQRVAAAREVKEYIVESSVEGASAVGLTPCTS